MTTSLWKATTLLWKAPIDNTFISDYVDIQEEARNSNHWLCWLPSSTYNNYIHRYFLQEIQCSLTCFTNPIYVLLILLIAISMVLQSIFLINTLILVFTVAAGWKYQKINLLAPKGSSNFDNANILSFFFIFLLSFIFLRKRRKGPRLKIILTSITFVVWILYRFSKPQNRLESCFTYQFFTLNTVEITNEVNTSYF